MPETKPTFTPGEWKYYRGTRTIYSGQEKAVALVFGPRHPTPEQRTLFESNARLIAAAPELYEACKDVLEQVLSPDYNYGVSEATFVKLRAAIEKAESR